jgi:hypothetical protein
LSAAVLAALVAGAAGYLIGSGRTAPPAQPGTTTPPAAAGAIPLVGTGKQCGVQVGERLQLGVEVANQSSSELRLDAVEPGLPLGGLRLTATAWGTCGQLRSDGTATAQSLPVGARTWVTMTFDVAVPCPAPFPVMFSVTYTPPAATAVRAEVGGFQDLGEVAYSGCTPPAR